MVGLGRGGQDVPRAVGRLSRSERLRNLHVARVTSDTFWYHCDALGSARVMTDTSGSQVWNCFYYPFGEQKWPESEQVTNSHQFTGKEWDTDMSLNYFCQRYYDPTIGRFMTLDPIAGYLEEPQSQNRHVYCINNPLKYVDPLGLWPRWLSKHNPEGYEEVVGWSGGSECVVTANRPYRPGRSLIGNLPRQDPRERGWGWANTGKNRYSSTTWDTGLDALLPARGGVVNTSRASEAPVSSPLTQFAFGVQIQSAAALIVKGYSHAVTWMRVPRSTAGEYVTYGESWGAEFGVSPFTAVFALGYGSWEGWLTEWELSLLYFQCSYFYSESPSLTSRWRGGSIGLGVSLPGGFVRRRIRTFRID